MTPPPSYEEVNGVCASQAHNGSTDSMGYFLGEVRLFLALKLEILYRKISVCLVLTFTFYCTFYSCRCYFPTMLSLKLNWIYPSEIILSFERFVSCPSLSLHLFFLRNLYFPWGKCFIFGLFFWYLPTIETKILKLTHEKKVKYKCTKM